MKKIYAVLTMATAILTSSIASAQEPFFNLTVLGDDYTPLTLPTSLTQGIPYDDPDYTVEFGFDFPYLGHYYQNINFDGWDGYGVEMILSSTNLATPYAQISPFMMDIIDGQYDNNGKADSDIRYVVEGEVGSRIFRIEWSNVAFYNEGAPYSMRYNLQMWLFENGVIEFHYGAQEGLDYNVINDYEGVPVTFVRELDVLNYTFVEMWTLSGDAANPTWQDYPTFDDFDAGVHLSTAPDNGTVYHFEPLLVSVEEMDVLTVALYPNPAQDQINVRGNWDLGSKYKILDQVGREVLVGNLASEFQTINIESLAAGLYFMQVSDKNEISVLRFNVK